MSEVANVSSREIAHFDALASRWWDADGESRPLHDLNPVRLAYIQARIELRGARVADVGCGQGHAINLMAQAFPNSRFTGYDFSTEGVAAGKAEAAALGLANAQATLERLAAQHGARFQPSPLLQQQARSGKKFYA